MSRTTYFTTLNVIGTWRYVIPSSLKTKKSILYPHTVKCPIVLQAKTQPEKTQIVFPRIDDLHFFILSLVDKKTGI